MPIKTTFTLLLAVTASVFAATPGAEILLWPDGAPGSEALRGKKEIVTGPGAGQDNVRVSGIHNPSILVYPPTKEHATGAAMIIAPGGGHRFLSLDTEGINVAKHLNGIGVAAFVLKYRLAREEGSPYKVDDAMADAQRAIRTVRARAAEWNVNPAKIGIMGFSAGGEVAVLASTNFDYAKPDLSDAIEKQSSRPDYQVLIYPGVRVENITIGKETPPTFMLCADNDKGPSLALSGLYPALKQAGVPVEMHIYNSGGHGFGLRPNPAKPTVINKTWILRVEDWMADIGMSARK